MSPIHCLILPWRLPRATFMSRLLPTKPIPMATSYVAPRNQIDRCRFDAEERRFNEPEVNCYFGDRRRTAVRAQAQNPSVAKVSKGDAQRVVKIISGDKAKTQTYCDIKKLDEQIAQTDEKKDSKMADELSQKVGELEKTLGPEYTALIDGLQGVDPETDEVGEEIMLTLLALDRLCTR